MIHFSDDYLYSREHVWIQTDEDGQIFLGAAEPLLTLSGNPDEVEYLMVEGDQVREGDIVARLLTEDDEWEIIAPFQATIISFNLELTDSPEILSDDPYDEGWLVRLEMENEEGLRSLMDASDYEDYITDLVAEAEGEIDEDDFDDDLDLDDDELDDEDLDEAPDLDDDEF